VKIDRHAALLALRAHYGHYRPLADKTGMADRLDAAQALLESLPWETLALSPVQAAVAELVPVTDEASRRYRGGVLSFLSAMGSPLATGAYRGILDPCPA
jgi:hypothetical protein